MDAVSRARRLPPDLRRDLLRVLDSDSRVRADVVRQLHDRGRDEWVELLTELEADDLLRERTILALRSGQVGPPP